MERETTDRWGLTPSMRIQANQIEFQAFVQAEIGDTPKAEELQDLAEVYRGTRVVDHTAE